MNIKQFLFLVVLYCIMHLAACYFQWRARQRYRDTRQTFTLWFDSDGVHTTSAAAGVFTGACYAVWFCVGVAIVINSVGYIWQRLA